MRILVLTDLEGICGVFRFEQTREFGTPANVEARHLLMGEVNACVAGCFDGGAERVVVRDGHDGAKSFFPDELDERAEMIMGSCPVGDMVAEGFDAAVLLGYHSMSHTPGGILCHTQSSLHWDNYWINGRLAGEIAQSAIMLGAGNVPVVMVTGDDKTVTEARDLLGDEMVTVRVKRGLAREGALMMAPKRAREMIRAAAAEAMRRMPKVKPYRPRFPLTIRWQF